MAHNQPAARPAWEVTYLDICVITHDQEVIEQAQAGNKTAQCNVVNMLHGLPRNHLKDLYGRPDPTAPFHRGLTIKQVA